MHLLYIPGFISRLDLQWTDPGFARFLMRLDSFARVILFDKPGTGPSDPKPSVPTVEERIEGVHVVLDAAGSERAAATGFSEGGSAAAVFAATIPTGSASSCSTVVRRGVAQAAPESGGGDVDRAPLQLTSW